MNEFYNDERGVQFAENGYVFLRSETKIVPLSCGWYAWTHLISPIQRAMNLTFRQLPLLRSFATNSAIHVAASGNPTLFGGPFLDFPSALSSTIERLLETATNKYAHLIVIASALKQVDEQLLRHARGQSLSSMYSTLPPALEGLVEFHYDLNNFPKLRVYEELFYDSEFGKDLSEVSLSLVPEDKRLFFMNAPHIDGENDITFPITLADPVVDTLASMRTRPQLFAEIARELKVDPLRRQFFRRYFSSIAPIRRAPSYDGTKVRMRYFGHACVLVETAEVAILIDPMFATEPSATSDRLRISDLPDKIDFVVISHNHQDHCAPEMLIQIRHKVECVVVPANNRGSIADPSMKLMLRRLGFKCIRVLEPFDSISFAGGNITSLPFPGEHVDLEIYSRHGILVELHNRRFCFLVDSDGWDKVLYRRIVGRIGKRLDALFLGMECHGAPLTWLYGPLLTKPISRRDDESRRLSGLDSDRAWNVLMEFEVGQVFVYAMGQEPWLRYIMGFEYAADSMQLREIANFLARCAVRGIRSEYLQISKEVEF
jgi:L-ascorbate metabolism protein UlaG (beta-lactamase superfamily)